MIESPLVKFASNFLVDEDGAVTVDWVMLTSGIVFLGVLVITLISSALSDTATGIALEINSALT